MSDTYRFKDKDFIIDLLRTCIQAWADMEGVSLRKALPKISAMTNYEVSHHCMNNWFFGPTISPRYCSVARVVLALKVDLRIGQRTMLRQVHPAKRRAVG